jgi:hypothetical protein
MHFRPRNVVADAADVAVEVATLCWCHGDANSWIAGCMHVADLKNN